MRARTPSGSGRRWASASAARPRSRLPACTWASIRTQVPTAPSDNLVSAAAEPSPRPERRIHADPLPSLSSAVAGGALRRAGELPALRRSARRHASLDRDAGRPRWPPGEQAPAALVVEQGALGLQAAGIAREAAVGADHPVTRDDDRDLVAAVGAAHSPRGAAELGCDLAV